QGAVGFDPVTKTSDLVATFEKAIAAVEAGQGAVGGVRGGPGYLAGATAALLRGTEEKEGPPPCDCPKSPSFRGSRDGTTLPAPPVVTKGPAHGGDAGRSRAPCGWAQARRTRSRCP